MPVSTHSPSSLRCAFAPGVPDAWSLGAESVEGLLEGALWGRDSQELLEESGDGSWCLSRVPLPGTPLPGQEGLRGAPRGIGTGWIRLRSYAPWSAWRSLGSRLSAPGGATPAEREWNLLCHLRAAGVATVEPLAVVADGASRRSVLVTRDVDPGPTLAEALALAGARVTGLDASGAAIGVARLHGYESGVAVTYAEGTAETLAAERPAAFDVVTCMELLEHVPDPASLVHACARLVRPGGTVVLSTINRNPKAYLLAVIGAEYVLGLLPRGTHDYARFIRPSELAGWARAAGLEIREVSGLAYNPFSGQASLSPRVQVNYFLVCSKPDVNDSGNQ